MWCSGGWVGCTLTNINSNYNFVFVLLLAWLRLYSFNIVTFLCTLNLNNASDKNVCMPFISWLLFLRSVAIVVHISEWWLYHHACASFGVHSCWLVSPIFSEGLELSLWVHQCKHPLQTSAACQQKFLWRSSECHLAGEACHTQHWQFQRFIHFLSF